LIQAQRDSVEPRLRIGRQCDEGYHTPDVYVSAFSMCWFFHNWAVSSRTRLSIVADEQVLNHSVDFLLRLSLALNASKLTQRIDVVCS